MIDRYQADLIEVGPLDLITPGQGRCVIVEGQPLAIFRLRDGQVFALDNRCPHRNGPLSEGVVGIDYATQLAAVICPLHAYKFALPGGRGLDTPLGVRSYAVTVCDDRIYVRMP